MATYTTEFVKGTIYWAKIVGDKALHSNYDGDSRQWAFEFVPEDVEFLKKHKLLDRLKDKEDPKNPDKGEYLNLRKPEFTKAGDKNEPIRIYTKDNEPWDDRLIGNGSKADVKLKIADFGPGKKKAIYTQAIRVTDLVSYESDEFAAMDDGEDRKPKRGKDKPQAKAPERDGLDELDDDIPPFD